MYVINCEDCGRIGFHPSRTGAESRAETHSESHEQVTPDCGISPMES